MPLRRNKSNTRAGIGEELGLEQYLDSSHRSGTPPPVAGARAHDALLRSSSSLQGGQGNGSPSSPAFQSLTSPRSSYNTLGNFSYLNGGGITQLSSLKEAIASRAKSGLSGPSSHPTGSNSGLSGSPTLHRSLSAESLAFAGMSSMGLPASPLSFSSSALSLTGTTGLVASALSRQGALDSPRIDQQELQQLQQQQQHQITMANSLCSQESHSHGQDMPTSQQQMLGGVTTHVRGEQSFGLETQQRLQSMQGMASVKLEQHQMNQQVQPMQGLVSVKLEEQRDSCLRQQIQPMQGLASVNLEQQLDASLRQQLKQQSSIQKMEMKPEFEMPQSVQPSLLTSHLQRQEALQIHRQQSQQQLQPQISFLQQQRLLQQHRAQLQQQQQLQQHLQQQIVGPSKQLVFEPGICARRLMQYMFSQRHRPQDNNIAFWRKFVGEYFAPRAKKRWCVSQYGSNGRQPTGVFPQDVWRCEICGSRPGRGFETTVEVLPRLCKIKYDSGILDELLYVDIANEYRLSSGLIVLEYGKAIQESIFEQLRVVRDGKLRITFSHDLKILSWEFCAKSHEELLPRRLLIPQVTQLAAIAQKHQNSVNQNHNGATGPSLEDFQTNCQLFVGSARQLARTLEAPIVNDLGYTKRYVRCLQISEVVNSLKDLIDFSRENRVGPIASLLTFPRRTANLGDGSSQVLQQQDQMDLQTLPLENHVSRANNGQSIISNHSLNGSVNSISHNTNSMGSFPQNSLTPLQNTCQNTVSNSIATDVNTSSGTAPNGVQSLGGTSINSLQSYHPSVRSQPVPLSTLSTSTQPNSVSLCQQSSGQTSQQDQHESSNAVHHLLQEMMMPFQLKTGASFQQALAGGGNVVGNGGVNGGMVGGVGNMMNQANGSMISSGGIGVFGGSSALISSSLCSGNRGNIGGMRRGTSGDEASLNSLGGNGNILRNTGLNMLVHNMGTMNALGGRHDLSAVDGEQNFGLQDPSQSFLHELGGNYILSSLGHTSLNNLPLSWKSP